MAGYTTLLEEALEAWQYTRDGLIEEVENIPSAEFGFRPTPELRSFGEVVKHVLESGLMAAGELTRPDGDFRRQSFAAFIEEHAGRVRDVSGKDGFLEWLRRSWEEGDAAFRTAGEIFMLQTIHRFDGQPGTRLAWLNHAIEHESYHRGQLALYARLLGHVPALTQRLS